MLLESVMAGRVIPGFTMSANPGLKIVRWPVLDWFTFGISFAGLALWVFLMPGRVTLCLFLLAAACHVLRQLRWHPILTIRRPILLILHAAYAWIPVSFILMAAGQMGWVSLSAGMHGLAVGLTGGLIIAMITRTARGHTGRILQASQPEILAFTLVMLAAFLRVIYSLLPSIFSPVLPAAAGTCWTTAFLIYCLQYGPWLIQPRVDGLDG